MGTMPQDAIVCGVDTHADVHTAAAVDSKGRVLAVENFETTRDGYAKLLHWLYGFGEVLAAGVEGTSS